MKRQQPQLRRSLGLLETTAGGVGIILGAGIYVLVGEAAGEAGNAVWLSFAITGVLAAATGLSYAELASTFPRAGADYEYTRQALGVRPAFVVGWLIVLGNLIAASAVALGFGSYLSTFLDIDTRALAAVILILASLISYLGVQQSVRLAGILTLIEVGGLVIVIAVGLPHLGDTDLLDAKSGAASVLSGAALAFFAYIGFEQIATLSEETRDVSEVVPRAILLAIGITTSLYVLVAMAAVSVLGWEHLSASDAPLAAVVTEAFGDRASDAVAIIALFSTGNTVLLLLIAASRLIYGMASRGSLPAALAWVHPGKQTPATAIALSLGVAAAFVLPGDLSLVAGATNFAVFVGFAAVNLSLIVLRYSHAEVNRPFMVPMRIHKVPLVPVFALGSVAFMMANLDRDALLVGTALLLSGVLAMFVFSGKQAGKD
jgi:APA family basic amino acid/polyamine antiporter